MEAAVLKQHPEKSCLVQHCVNNDEYSTWYLHQHYVVVSQQCHRGIKSGIRYQMLYRIPENHLISLHFHQNILP